MTTDRRVPWKRPEPAYAEVRIAAPVRGRLWQDLADLYQWLRGSGAHLIPEHRVGVSLTGGAARTLRYRVEPSGRAIQRLWMVRLRSTWKLGDRPARGTVAFPGGGTVSVSPFPYSVPMNTSFETVYFVEQLGAKSLAEQELAVTVTHESSSADLVIEGVACLELPRAVLSADATDLGVSVESVRTGEPIYEDAARYRGVTALVRNLGEASTELRRSLHQHAFRTVTTTAAAPVTLYQVPIPILARRREVGVTTAPVRCAIYARVTDGSTVVDAAFASARAGDSGTITVSGPSGHTSLAWRGPVDVDVECEDLTTADGRPGGTESIQLTLTRTAGSGSIVIESVSIWEPVP